MKILFPCPYGIDHMRTMNAVLCRSFSSFVGEVPYGQWKASRTTRSGMIRKLYRTLRAETGVEAIFFSNLLSDATTDLKTIFPEIKLFGYVHGTNLSFEDNPLASRRQIAHERALYRAATGIFVGSSYLKENLLHAFPELQGKVFVVGFPYQREIVVKPSKRQPVILYNHRFDRNKQPLHLIPLKQMLPGFSFVATSPNFNPFTFGALKKAGVRGYINPNETAYRELLDSAMFQVSFARHETFGVATQTAVLHGAFALAPNRASYPEFLPAEMLYADLDELAQKVRYYARHSGERLEIVRRTQESFQNRFRGDVWRNIVENHIEKLTA